MAYIQVDHQQLDKAADAVEAYITKQNRKMNEMDSSEMVPLSRTKF